MLLDRACVVDCVPARAAISTKDEGRRTKDQPAYANLLSSFVLRRYTPLHCTKRLAICLVALGADFAQALRLTGCAARTGRFGGSASLQRFFNFWWWFPASPETTTRKNK